MSEILLLGATGFTGRMIGELLAKRGVPFAVGGRDVARVDAATKDLASRTEEVLAVDVLDRASVDAAVRRFPTVISCVGPYEQWGRGVVESCVEHGRLYVDVTGESSFVRWSVDTFGERAKETGALIVHSCSFESAYPDILAAKVLSTDRTYRRIDSIYRMVPPMFQASSPGTLLTIQLASHRDSLAWEDGKYGIVAPMSRDVDASFVQPGDAAFFISYPEVVFFPRRYKAARVGSYMVMPRAVAEGIRTIASKQAVRSVDEIVDAHRKSTRAPLTREETASSTWTVGIRAIDEDGATLTATMKGRDGYAATAVMAVEIATRRAASERPSGVRSPAEAHPDLDGLFAVLAAEVGVTLQLPSKR